MKIWTPGEELLIAASLMDLFAPLPHSAQFAEQLVDCTLQLESIMHRYEKAPAISPFREPLARFLNRHCPSECSLLT